MDPKTIGANVRAYREARGWTQQELARHAMTCTGTVYLIERGRKSHVNTLRRVARALRVKLRQLEQPMAAGDVIESGGAPVPTSGDRRGSDAA